MILGNAKTSKLGMLSYSGDEKYNQIHDIDPQSETSHAKIVKHINGVGLTVLDLGCSGGVIGRHLHKNNKCKIYGADIDITLVEKAKSDNAYVEVRQVDLDNIQGALPFKKKFFDIIILADVIEHLRNQEKLFEILPEYLKENGKIFVSLPNIAHQNIILGLLNKDFNYNDIGILDSTHLRFFTDKSFLEFVDNINDRLKGKFYRAKIVDRIIDIDQETNTRDRELLDIIKTDDMDVLQYIFELRLVSTKVDNKIKYQNEYIKHIHRLNTKLDKLRRENEKYKHWLYRISEKIINATYKIMPQGTKRRSMLVAIKKKITRRNTERRK